MEREIEARMVDEIRASSEAYENLLVLADDIGIRLAGTSNEIAARDFLVEKLKQYGLDQVRTEAFQHRAWTPAREELLVLAPAAREIPCRCAGLSPSTSEGGVEGGVVFLERADRQEFEERREEVAVLEAARGLARYRRHLRRTIKFGLFGVEESGLVGSWAYAFRHQLRAAGQFIRKHPEKLQYLGYIG